MKTEFITYSALARPIGREMHSPSHMQHPQIPGAVDPKQICAQGPAPGAVQNYQPAVNIK